MSRTIRRTKAKKTRSRFEKDYTHYIPEEWDGREQGNRGVKWIRDFPLMPLEGKEFEIAYWKYHSDNGFAVFFYEEAFERANRISNREWRAQQKAELNRWIKNPEHEVIFQRPKMVWDYY